MSAVTGIYLFCLLLNIVGFFVLRSFFILINSLYPDDVISPVYKSKKTCTEKWISLLKCSRASFLKIFLAPYAYTGCYLRVGQFDVSASIFASIFHQAQVNGQWKRIIRSQLVVAHVAGPQLLKTLRI